MRRRERAGSLFTIEFGLIVAVLAGGGAMGGAQETPPHPCVARAPYPLAKILKAIEEKAPEDALVRNIESCHVGFDLDAATLDQLSAAGASDRLMDVLNRVTTPELTLARAAADVAALQSQVTTIDQSIDGDRNAALKKLDVDFQVKRQQAANVAPKGEFETTQAYNARRMKAGEVQQQLDLQYQTQRDQITSQYAAQASQKEKPFRTRIAYLQKSTYTENLVPTFKSYDADKQLLAATIDGEPYEFNNVPGNQAKAMYDNWKKVIVARKLTGDSQATQYLRLQSAGIEVIGRSLKSIQLDAQNHRAAQVHLSWALARAGNYVAASRGYNAVLAEDPGNTNATAGVAAIRDIEAQLAQLPATQKAAGEWVEANINPQLMWTLKDNGHDINWKGAQQYCQGLQLGGYSDWRLPHLVELESIVDRSSTRMTPRGNSLKALGQAELGIRAEDPSPVPYHISGEIALTATFVWTADVEPNPGDGMSIVAFKELQWTNRLPTEKTFLRALCVRNYAPSIGAFNVPEPPNPSLVADQ